MFKTRQKMHYCKGKPNLCRAIWGISCVWFSKLGMIGRSRVTIDWRSSVLSSIDSWPVLVQQGHYIWLLPEYRQIPLLSNTTQPTMPSKQSRSAATVVTHNHFMAFSMLSVSVTILQQRRFQFQLFGYIAKYGVETDQLDSCMGDKPIVPVVIIPIPNHRYMLSTLQLRSLLLPGDDHKDVHDSREHVMWKWA